MTMAETLSEMIGT